MAKSSWVRFRGRNHLAVNHISPLDTDDTGLNFYSDKESTTIIGRINSTTGKFQFDELTELTSGVGITIDSLLIKDGTIIVDNNVFFKCANTAGTALDILKVNASNALELSALWNTAAVRTSLGAAASGANTDITSLTTAALTVTTSNGGNQEVLFNNGRVTTRNTGAAGASTVAAWASDYATNYGEVSLNRYNVSHASWAGRGELYFQNCTTRKIRWNGVDGLVFENTDGDLWDLDVDLIPSTNLASDLGSAAKKVDNGHIDKVYCNKLYFDSANDYIVNESTGSRTLDDNGDITNVRSVLRQVIVDFQTRGMLS